MNNKDLENLKAVSKVTTCFIDLDNTLWEGILAEGQEPKLFSSRLDVLKKLHSKGIQLYIISKNDESDVNKAFEKLKIDKKIFTWIVANWDAKYVNIDKIIRACEIRPETAIFIDDNIFELNEVKQIINTIHLVEAEDINFILTIPTIESKSEQSDAEIEERKNRYRTAIKSQFFKEKFTGSDIDFYRKLHREVRVGLVPADNLERVLHLFVETHRLNFSPGKFADYDIARDYIHERFNAGDQVLAVSTLENGLSLGLTGVLIVHIEDNEATITDGTFSCGIIGRDFEAKSILILIDRLKAKDVYRLKINFILTATNLRIRDILENLEFKAEKKETDQKDNLHLVYSLVIKSYNTSGKYEWIAASNEPVEFDFVGHPYIMNFFDKYVKPLFSEGKKVVNLGSAKGEVIGLLQPGVRRSFYDFIDEKKVEYVKVDLEYSSEERNIVANAEDLSKVFEDESVDIVMALELLEHTLRPDLIISEMVRICKKDGYIIITVPSFNFAKHEYPIDLWRFGPKTLRSFFERPGFEILQLEIEGDQKLPRGTMILVKKTESGRLNVKMTPGKMDIIRGVTVFE